MKSDYLRTIDEQIAKALGWTTREATHVSYGGRSKYTQWVTPDGAMIADRDFHPNFSHSANSMLELIEEMRARRFVVDMGSDSKGWLCAFTWEAGSPWNERRVAVGGVSTLPEAVARAAIAALNSTPRSGAV